MVQPLQAHLISRVTCTLALVASTVLASACSDKAATLPAKVADPARAVSVATVEMRPLGGNTSTSGLLVPREEAAVNSELSGFRVADVFVEEGAVVRAGQPLVRLDDALLRARINQAKAAMSQAQAQGAQAQSESDRVIGLDGTGVLSDEAIAQRRTQASSVQASVAVAQAQLDDLTTQAGRMTLRSPVTGLVLERNVRPGATQCSASRVAA
jgi:HlyD family secretion protein